jgi:hypothetical protein
MDRRATVSSGERASSRNRRRWLIAAGAAILLLVLVAIAGYQFTTTADALHLIVSESSDASRVTRDTTAKDPEAVQRLYSHTLALPTTSSGSYSCPIGPKLRYRLVFSHRGITTLDTTVGTESCQFIQVFWSTRYADDQLWALLGQAVNQQLPFGES